MGGLFIFTIIALSNFLFNYNSLRFHKIVTGLRAREAHHQRSFTLSSLGVATSASSHTSAQIFSINEQQRDLVVTLTRVAVHVPVLCGYFLYSLLKTIRPWIRTFLYLYNSYVSRQIKIKAF